MIDSGTLCEQARALQWRLPALWRPAFDANDYRRCEQISRLMQKARARYLRRLMRPITR